MSVVAHQEMTVLLCQRRESSPDSVLQVEKGAEITGIQLMHDSLYEKSPYMQVNVINCPYCSVRIRSRWCHIHSR